jgi:protein SCO1
MRLGDSIYTLPIVACGLMAGCAPRYAVNGLVLSVDPPARTMLVSHRPIPGFMDAMVMPFDVRNRREIEGLQPGAQVDFELVAGNRPYARSIRPVQGAGPLGSDDGEAFALTEPESRVPVGAPFSDFELTDQSGAVRRLSRDLGKVVAVNFIYTRCPLPNVCPALTARFARLQRRFQDEIGGRLVLYSITLDPQYDTPEELGRYAKLWKANPEGWRFLTGTPGQVREVAEKFGVVYWPEEGLLTHTSQTAILGKDGTLRALIEGNTYHVQQLGDLIQRELEER